jgi:PKD domain
VQNVTIRSTREIAVATACLALTCCAAAFAQAPNARPVVSGIAGPATGTTGQTLTYTVNAFDPDGAIVNFAFDLDGDGAFEHDNGPGNVVATRYDAAGTRNLGVRVLDDRGGVAYASIAVTIAGAQGPPARPPHGIVDTFRLDRPVFGGTKRRRLAVRYAVREAARVTITLQRGRKRVRRLVRDKPRVARRTYRLVLAPRKLARGTYTLRLTATAAGGAVQRATLTATRL